MEIEDPIRKQDLNKNLRNSRIVYRNGLTYTLVTSPELYLSAETILTFSGMINSHKLNDGTKIVDPLSRLPNETDEQYSERLLRIKKLYGLEELSDNDIVKYLVAMYIIRGDPLGEFRRDTQQLVSDEQMVAANICNLSISDE